MARVSDRNVPLTGEPPKQISRDIAQSVASASSEKRIGEHRKSALGSAYAWLYRIWGVGFWIAMIGGGLHGMIMRGPVWYGYQLYAQSRADTKYRTECINFEHRRREGVLLKTPGAPGAGVSTEVRTNLPEAASGGAAGAAAVTTPGTQQEAVALTSASAGKPVVQEQAQIPSAASSPTRGVSQLRPDDASPPALPDGHPPVPGGRRWGGCPFSGAGGACPVTSSPTTAGAPSTIPSPSSTAAQQQRAQEQQQEFLQIDSEQNRGPPSGQTEAAAAAAAVDAARSAGNSKVLNKTVNNTSASATSVPPPLTIPGSSSPGQQSTQQHTLQTSAGTTGPTLIETGPDARLTGFINGPAPAPAGLLAEHYDCGNSDPAIWHDEVWRYMHKHVYPREVMNPKFHNKPEEIFKGPFYWYHQLVVLAIVVFFGYCEGYRGFHLMFSPMLVRRSWEYPDLYAYGDQFADETSGDVEAAQNDERTPALAAGTKVNQTLSLDDLEISNKKVEEVPLPLERYRYFGQFRSALLDLVLAPFLIGGFYFGSLRRLLVSWLLFIFICLCVWGLLLVKKHRPSSCVPEFSNMGLTVGLGFGFVSIIYWGCLILIRRHCCGLNADVRRRTPGFYKAGVEKDCDWGLSTQSWYRQ
ncbi:unnamed protein product [Amoebophrya sp. A25]|nr:unnamed protein product [Amoebophrya sp. A25]|eukprot:GSA25T00026180001.1